MSFTQTKVSCGKKTGFLWKLLSLEFFFSYESFMRPGPRRLYIHINFCVKVWVCMCISFESIMQSRPIKTDAKRKIKYVT